VNHLDTTIESPRLILRPFAVADIKPFFAFNQDPEVRRFIGGAPLSMEFCREHIPRLRASWERDGFAQCAIVRKADGQLIGRGGINMLDQLKMFEVSWVIARTEWGNGYGAEAGQAAMAYAFDVLGMDALCAPIHQQNVASIRIAQNLMMQLTGFVDVYGTGQKLANYVMTAKHWQSLPRP
jgi:RimJ/RimL family protein N-acetyltransferase